MTGTVSSLTNWQYIASNTRQCMRGPHAHGVGPGRPHSSMLMPSSARTPDTNLSSAGGSWFRSLGSRGNSLGRRPRPACRPLRSLPLASGAVSVFISCFDADHGRLHVCVSSDII